MVKRCLVLGSANCLRDDLERALNMVDFHGVVACKDAGLEWRGQLDAWVSLHPDRFIKYVPARAALGYPPARDTYAHLPAKNVSVVLSEWKFEGQKQSGSSGVMAIKVAIELLGFDKAVLCGIPLLKDQGRIDGKTTWNGASTFHRGFEQSMPAFKDRVRSMSGWTAIRVGTPTLTWLEAE